MTKQNKERKKEKKKTGKMVILTEFVHAFAIIFANVTWGNYNITIIFYIIYTVSTKRRYQQLDKAS